MKFVNKIWVRLWTSIWQINNRKSALKQDAQRCILTWWQPWQTVKVGVSIFHRVILATLALTFQVFAMKIVHICGILTVWYNVRYILLINFRNCEIWQLIRTALFKVLTSGKFHIPSRCVYIENILQPLLPRVLWKYVGTLWVVSVLSMMNFQATFQLLHGFCYTWLSTCQPKTKALHGEELVEN